MTFFFTKPQNHVLGRAKDEGRSPPTSPDLGAGSAGAEGRGRLGGAAHPGVLLYFPANRGSVLENPTKAIMDNLYFTTGRTLRA